MLKLIQLRKKDKCSMKPASTMGTILPFPNTQATHTQRLSQDLGKNVLIPGL